MYNFRVKRGIHSSPNYTISQGQGDPGEFSSEGNWRWNANMNQSKNIIVSSGQVLHSDQEMPLDMDISADILNPLIGKRVAENSNQIFDLANQSMDVNLGAMVSTTVASM